MRLKGFYALVGIASLMLVAKVFGFFTSVETKTVVPSQKHSSDSAEVMVLQFNANKVIGELESKMLNNGLVNLWQLDSSIAVNLKYAQSDNFMGMALYNDLRDCYLQFDVAVKVMYAQNLLQNENPNYRLIVYDGTRPRCVQRMMWDTLKMPANEKSKFICNPENGSLHNFGAAVDISIVDKNGYEIDMGTDYDYMGELAYPRLEEKLVKEGKLSEEQVANRKLLRKVMEESGFKHIDTEWWHFNAYTREEAKRKFKIVE